MTNKLINEINAQLSQLLWTLIDRFWPVRVWYCPTLHTTLHLHSVANIDNWFFPSIPTPFDWWTVTNKQIIPVMPKITSTQEQCWKRSCAKIDRVQFGRPFSAPIVQALISASECFLWIKTSLIRSTKISSIWWSLEVKSFASPLAITS